MSVCVSSAGGLAAALGPGSSSGMLPHRHHSHHLPGLMQLNHQPIGSSALMALPPHLFHPNDHLQPVPLTTPVPPPPLPPINGLLGGGHPASIGVPLGTMDSQCASEPQQPPPPTQALANPSSDDQYPNPDMLLALIARNKALEGE